MVKTIDIVSKTKDMKTYRLPHQSVCIRAGQCLCVQGRHSAIHLPGFHTVKGLSPAVLCAPDIEVAIVKGEILVRESKNNTHGAAREKSNSAISGTDDSPVGSRNKKQRKKMRENQSGEDTGEG